MAQVFDIISGQFKDAAETELADLWLLAFPEDSSEVFDFFWNGRPLSLADAFCAIIDGHVRSMAFAVTCGRLMATEITRKAAERKLRAEQGTFIVGVGTHPDFRGQGLAGNVMRAVCKGAARTGSFVQLSTFIPKFYERLGFKAFASHRLISCAPGSDCGITVRKAEGEEGADIVRSIYEKYSGPGCFLRSTDFCRWRIKASEAAPWIFLKDGEAAGYALSGAEPDFFDEVCAADAACLQAMAAYRGRICRFELAQPHLIEQASLLGTDEGPASVQMILRTDADKGSAENSACFCLDNW